MAKKSTTANKKPILELSQVHKNYQLGDVTIPALAGVTLSIYEGEMIAITGSSGSGKSTLLHVMGLLDKHSEGKLKFLEKETGIYDEIELAYLRNRYLGFVFQQFNLLPKTTSVENVLLPFYYSGEKNITKARQRATNLLVEVGLGERLNNYSNQLSGGQQQRVAIARALMNDPKVVFADEPTGNLDSKSGDEITDLLIKLHKQGKTVIIVTHDDELAKIAPRQIKMLDGKITSDTTKSMKKKKTK
jgi:ABC-type lipoprotein export system ATPase subunit